jgi:hypothetical protein
MFIVLLIHLVTTVFRLAGPGGLRSVVAESVLIRHQLLIVTRSSVAEPLLRTGRWPEHPSKGHNVPRMCPEGVRL